MLKGGCLNPQMAPVLASLGHKDILAVSDAGLPIPTGMERFGLAWKCNEPSYLPILEEVLRMIVVEKAILAEELKTVSPEMHEKILNILLKNLEIEYVPHIELKA